MTRVVPLCEEKPAESAIVAILRPCLFFLQLVGGYTGGSIDTSDTRSQRCKLHLHKLYCFFVNVVVVCGSAIYVHELIKMPPFSTHWFRLFALLSAKFICEFLVMTNSFQFGDRQLQRCISNLEDYGERFQLSGSTKTYSRQMRTVQKIVTTVLLLFFITLDLAICTLPSNDDSFLVEYMPQWLNYSIMVMVVCAFWGNTIATFELIFVATYIFKNEFEKINCEFKRIYLSLQAENKFENTDTRETKVSSLCYQHEELSTILSQFNNIMKFIFGTLYFASIPVACTMLYFLLTKVETYVDEMIGTIMMIVCFVPSTTFCIIASNLHNKAHGSLQYIWKISPRMKNTALERELQMMATKLTGTTIAYSVFGLFDITYSSSLSIAGTLLTYFIVVVQFRQTTPICSCTGPGQNLINNITDIFSAVLANSSCNT